ncbi:hypothetical protein M1563_00355 [Patescibacteria group bacterium]|nr:hypothetical protein [Patescibacteria group bacterium]MCL5409985.1 hypothetical protein [Patescibacteria group bacterium]
MLKKGSKNMLGKLCKYFTSTFFLVVIYLAFGQTASASTLYLSPGSANVGVGGVISVQVRLNTAGEAVNAVSAVLTYPQDKVDVAWISYGSSAFSIAAEGSYGGGAIRISRGNINGVTGNVNVATIGFKGKALGKATVAFVGGSAAPRATDSTDSLVLGSSAGGVYTVVQSLPTPTPKPLEALTISDVSVSNITKNGAIISWTTNKPADSTVEYGLDMDQYVFSTSSAMLTTNHTLTLSGPSMVAGTNFHYRVESKDASGSDAISPDGTFQLVGYNIKIKITDQTGAALANTDVLLYSDPLSGKTDQNGEVSFENVTPGKHLVVVKLGNNEKTSEILVKESDTPQNFSLVISAAANTSLSGIIASITGFAVRHAAIVGGVVLLIAVLVAGFFLYKKYKKGGPLIPPFNHPVNKPPQQSTNGPQVFIAP